MHKFVPKLDRVGYPDDDNNNNNKVGNIKVKCVTDGDVCVVRVLGVPAAGVVERQAVVALNALGGGRHEFLRLHLLVLACTIHVTCKLNIQSKIGTTSVI